MRYIPVPFAANPMWNDPMASTQDIQEVSMTYREDQVKTANRRRARGVQRKPPSMVSNTTSEIAQKRRNRSSEKERRRNIDLNDAFYKLQCQIPRLEHTQRLPRIKTLRMAILYINHLMDYLAGKETEDFAKQAMQEMQMRNSYTARVLEEVRPPPPRDVPLEYYVVSPSPCYAMYEPTPSLYWNHSLPSTGSDQSSP